MSLRVVHVCAYFAPAFVYGGPPRSIAGLCRAQQDAGIDVRVVTTTANGDTELDSETVVRGHYDGVPVHYCERTWPRSVFYAPSLRNVVSEHVSNADVVHIHGLWNATVWTAAAAAAEARKPYVLSPRGMLSPAALAHNQWRKRLVYPFADARVVRRAARLHATSGTEFNELNCIPATGRGVYVPNGVDMPRSTNGSRSPMVLFLGRIHPIKRLDLLATAFAQVLTHHPNAQLVIAGPDEGGHRATVAPLFAPFADAVTWTGRVDDDKKNELLAKASVLVMCSNSESFGMSAAEAMAAGTPVVVTRTCPWPDIETHQSGYWVEQNAGAIADAVTAVLSHPTAAAEMGQRGRQLIAANYSWSIAAAALIREYQNLAH